MFTSHVFALDARPVAVLVPGFFNSLSIGYISAHRGEGVQVHQYFSKDIVDAFERNGVEAVVVDTLSPVGTLETNGDRLIAFLDKLETNPAFANRPLHLVGHSAGGLYSFYAIAKRPNIGVKSLTTLSTPFAGAELTETLAKGVPGLEAAVNLMDLRSLPQLKPRNVARFIAQFDLPKNFVIKVFAGHQTFGLDVTNAKNLSWPMATMSTLIGKPSDGIVSVDSAYATGILTRTQGALPIQKGKNLIPLEHWEQVLDARVFGLLGVRNPSFIRDQQTNFYGALARNLAATK
jgi:pimeloyl-ACP methyl ester carboxylesterase